MSHCSMCGADWANEADYRNPKFVHKCVPLAEGKQRNADGTESDMTPVAVQEKP